MAGMAALPAIPNAAPEMVPVPFTVSVLAGGVISTIWQFRRRNAWRSVERERTDAAISDYLDELGYQERVNRPPTPTATFPSLRAQQHHWYGEHRELTSWDREMAEMWGMDADTYVSNWLEAE